MAGDSKDEQISDTLAQALLDHTPRGLYLRAVRAEADYKRAHRQASNALSEVARLQHERDEARAEAAEQRQRADALERELSETKKEVTDAEDRERAKDEAIRYARSTADAFRAVHENRDNRFPTDEHRYRRINTLMVELMAWDADLAQQPTNRPTTGEQSITPLRVSSGSDGVVFRLGNGFAFEVHDNDLDGLLDDIESVRDGGYLDTGVTVAIRNHPTTGDPEDQARPRCTHTRLVKDRCPVCGKLGDDNRPVGQGADHE